MKQNLGKLDRIFRFGLAFWWLGPWMPQYNIPLVSWVIVIIGWIALFESLSGWCWLHTMFKINNKAQ